MSRLRRRSSGPGRGAVVLAAGLIGAAAVGAAGWAWRRRSAAGERDEAQRWRCECGQDFRVVGEGRHRLFWVASAPPSDPVLDGQCPSCGRALHQEAAVAGA